MYWGGRDGVRALAVGWGRAEKHRNWRNGGENSERMIRR